MTRHALSTPPPPPPSYRPLRPGPSQTDSY